MLGPECEGRAGFIGARHALKDCIALSRSCCAVVLHISFMVVMTCRDLTEACCTVLVQKLLTNKLAITHVSGGGDFTADMVGQKA